MCSCSCASNSFDGNFQLNSSIHIPQRKNKNYLMKCLVTLFTFILFQENIKHTCAKFVSSDNYAEELPVVYSQTYVRGFNCSPATIKEFPPDFFSQEYRERGLVVIHLLITFYMFYAFAIVCGDYFIPSVHQLSEDLQMEFDIAGATLMGIATSSPELFTNVVGTFIMKGDIGVGTVVGSAAFNLLIVATCIGFDAKDAVKLDWWPLTRDMTYYGVSVIALFIVLIDEVIYWWEAFILLLIYAMYIYGMYHDELLQNWAEKFLCLDTSKLRRKRRRRKRETWTLENTEAAIHQFNSSRTTIVNISQTVYPLEQNGSEEPKSQPQSNNDSRVAFYKTGNEIMKPNVLPRGQSYFVWFQWIIGWPIRLMLSLTIPNCRNVPCIYPLSFIMSTFWIGLLSYIATWMMTIVGHTFRIPDTVFGVSIIAAGTSIPEVVSSVIVARNGLLLPECLGTMAVSNSIGSNTFDILVCLGIPWLIRALIDTKARIYATALLYSTGMLMFTLIFFYIIVAFNRFYVDKKVAAVSLALYLVFVTVDSLLELNVFFFVNMPVCHV